MKRQLNPEAFRLCEPDELGKWQWFCKVALLTKLEGFVVVPRLNSLVDTRNDMSLPNDSIYKKPLSRG